VVQVFRDDHPRLHGRLEESAPDLEVPRIREQSLLARLVRKLKDEQPVDLVSAFSEQHARDDDVVSERAAELLEQRPYPASILRVARLILHPQSHGHFVRHRRFLLTNGPRARRRRHGGSLRSRTPPWSDTAPRPPLRPRSPAAGLDAGPAGTRGTRTRASAYRQYRARRR